MKHLLVVQFDAPGPITKWEILPSEHDVSHFLQLSLAELKGATINGFTCGRLDGQDLTQAIENCETVAVGSAIQDALS